MLLTYALLFLLVALVASVLGFAAVASVGAVISVICFGLFLGLFLDAVIRGRKERAAGRQRHEH